MRLYGGAEKPRRNGAVALLVLGSAPFLSWIYFKIARVAAGGPLFLVTPGLGDAIVVGLFALVVWNCWRIRAHPKDFADLDRAAGEARVYLKGRKVRTVPVSDIGPVRMFERIHRTSKSTGGGGSTMVYAGSSIAVQFGGLSGYDICDYRSEPRARRRMEAVSREFDLASVTLGGIERSAAEINLSLIERVRRQGETVTVPVAPASTPITWRASGDALEIRSSHVAIVPLLIAAGATASWIYLTWSAWPQFQAPLLAVGSWSWAATGVVVTGVPVLIVVLWLLRAALLPGRVTVSPSGLRYRFTRVRLDAVEEIAAGRGNAPRVWTDRGPINISNGFCPANQYGYLAQLLRWAIVETASKRDAVAVSRKPSAVSRQPSAVSRQP